jgi:hypothetical protein
MSGWTVLRFVITIIIVGASLDLNTLIVDFDTAIVSTTSHGEGYGDN